MPKVLDELPDDHRRYPWHTWMDGQIREFTHDVDFDCAPKTFARLARRAAWNSNPRRKVLVRVKARTSTVVVQFLPPEANND